MSALLTSKVFVLSTVTIFSAMFNFSESMVSVPAQPETVSIEWEEMENADGYDIYKSEDKEGRYRWHTRIEDRGVTEYTDSEVTAGQIYYYKIKWYCNVGNLTVTSDATKSVSAIPQPQKQQSVDIPLREDPEDPLMLVNKTASLSSSYVPTGLVSLGEYGTGGQTAKEDVKSAFASLYRDASKEGLTIKVVSGYRSYELQEELYAYWCMVDGVTQANRTSAKPGKSEHQTGYALDVSCASEAWDLQESFGDTPEGKWIAENGHKYGFIVRYGQNQESITGYAYEPWHIRYVGPKAAAEIYSQGITLEEYLEEILE